MLALSRVQGKGQIAATVIRVAVLFVPGIMGTRLTFSAAQADDDDDGPSQIGLWDPDSTTNMLRWGAASPENMARSLRLSNAAEFLGTGADDRPNEVARHWPCLAKDFYAPFLRRLQKDLRNVGLHRCTVYAAPYDWRMPNKVSAARIVRQILELAPTYDRFILVTHSMGGIVGRFVAQRSEVREHIEAVIHLAQPVDGAVVAYRRLLGGAPHEVDGRLMRHLLGDRPEDVATIVSELPGAIELLPTPDYRPDRGNPASWWLHERTGKTIGEVGPGPGSDVYDMYLQEEWPPSAIPASASPEVRSRMAGFVRSARKSWSSLGRNMHRATWSIYGTNVTTDVHVEFRRRDSGRPAVHFEEGRLPEGDGTVPAASASGLFDERAPFPATCDPELFRQFELEGVVHDEFCLHPDVQDGVVELIRAIVTPPRLTEFGEITWDRGVFWAKALQALRTKDSQKAKDFATELRVAKLLRQEGHAVHLIAESTAAGEVRPDIRIDGSTNVDVKRPVDIDGPDTDALMQHGAEQVGPGGIVVIVYSDDAFQRTGATIDRFQTRAREFEATFGAQGISFRVVDEADLPPLL